jgi:hypothetical protein
MELNPFLLCFSLEGGNVSGKELTGAFVLPEIMGYNGSAAAKGKR